MVIKIKGFDAALKRILGALHASVWIILAIHEPPNFVGSLPSTTTSYFARA